MDLSESREAVKRVDEQMAVLFEQRMDAVREIARYKSERGLPVEDLEQEARVIAERSALIVDDELRPFYIQFLQNTMDVSKSWQRHLIDS